MNSKSSQSALEKEKLLTDSEGSAAAVMAQLQSQLTQLQGNDTVVKARHLGPVKGGGVGRVEQQTDLGHQEQ